MANGITIDVKGVPELQELFAQLAGPAADRAMIAGVTAGAEIFQQAITDAAPVRPDLPSGTALPPGALKSHIQIRLAKLRSGTIATFIEPSSAVRHVARWAEYGHDLIRGGRKGSGGRFIRRVQPVNGGAGFVRPAFESSVGEATRAVENTIHDELIAEAENLGLR